MVKRRRGLILGTLVALVAFGVLVVTQAPFVSAADAISVTLTSSADPTSAAPGETVSIGAVLTNTTESGVENTSTTVLVDIPEGLSLKGELPSAVTVSGVEAQPTISAPEDETNDIQIAFASLTYNQAATISFDVTVDDATAAGKASIAITATPNGGTAVNAPVEVTVTEAPTGDDPGNKPGDEPGTEPGNPSVNVEGALSPSTGLVIGSEDIATVTYTLSNTEEGSDTGPVTFSVTIPSEVSLVPDAFDNTIATLSPADAGTIEESTGGLYANLSTLSYGKDVTLTFDIVPTEGVEPGTVTIKSTLTPTNGTGATNELTIPIAAGSGTSTPSGDIIKLNITPETANVQQGGALPLMVSLSNQVHDSSTGPVTLSIALPDGVTVTDGKEGFTVTDSIADGSGSGSTGDSSTGSGDSSTGSENSSTGSGDSGDSSNVPSSDTGSPTDSQTSSSGVSAATIASDGSVVPVVALDADGAVVTDTNPDDTTSPDEGTAGDTNGSGSNTGTEGDGTTGGTAGDTESGTTGGTEGDQTPTFGDPTITETTDGYEFAFPSFEYADSVAVGYEIDVAETAKPGPAVINYEVSYEGLETPLTGSTTLTVSEAASDNPDEGQLSLGLSPADATVTIGNAQAYTFTLTNNGPAIDTPVLLDVTVSDKFGVQGFTLAENTPEGIEGAVSEDNSAQLVLSGVPGASEDGTATTITGNFSVKNLDGVEVPAEGLKSEVKLTAMDEAGLSLAQPTTATLTVVPQAQTSGSPSGSDGTLNQGSGDAGVTSKIPQTGVMAVGTIALASGIAAAAAFGIKKWRELH